MRGTRALFSNRISGSSVPRVSRRATPRPKPLPPSSIAIQESTSPSPLTTPPPAEIPSNYLKKVEFPRKPFSNHVVPQMGAASVLSHNALVVFRELEMMNVFLGYEQANKYAIKTYDGTNVGYIAEEESTFTGAIARQLLRTRRPFKAVVLDVHGTKVLEIYRPFQMFLNSTISISTPEGVEIGKVVSDWHLWRRRYDLFINNEQVARIDDALLAWDFNAKDKEGGILSSINRNFSGFIKEMFTDMGQYVVHYDATPDQVRSLSLDERAVLLACAVTLDIDYFSRHSNHSSPGLLPIGMGGGGGGGGVGGGAPMPMPDIGASEAPLPSIGDDVLGGPSQSTPSSQPTLDSTPPPTSQGKNQWGDDEFLSDEQAGISSSEDSSSFLQDAWDMFNDEN